MIAVVVNNQNVAAPRINDQGIVVGLRNQNIANAIVGLPGPSTEGTGGGFSSVNLTSDRTVTSADRFTRFYTTDATETISATLQNVQADDEFIFILRENQRLNLVMSGITLQLGPGDSTTGTVYSDIKGSVLHLWAESSTKVSVQSAMGSWVS